ncbi:hypothetical protein Tco_0912700, partial [Tanacetum coccineum]
MSFSKSSDNSSICYTKPLDSLKHWNDHFFWVNAFACMVSFPWHTNKNFSRDPLPKSTKFNVDGYGFLVAHPDPFWKFLEPFLYLVGMSHYYTMDEDTYPRNLCDDGDMDLSAFIHVVDPTKVKIVEREHAKGERKLLDSTVGCVVPLLPVAPAHTKGGLEASVDKLFNEGGSADQRDSAVDGGHDVEIETVMKVKDIVAETVNAEKPKHQRKKRPSAVGVSGSSLPPKKLRGDHRTSSGVATGGKSSSVLKELLARSILNVEVGVEAVATLPLITSSVSIMLEHEGGDPTDSVTRANIRTIGPSERFIISSYSSHYSSTNASKAEVNSIIRSAFLPPVMTEAVVTSHAVSAPSILIPETGTKITSPVYASMFHDSDSMETVRPNVAGPSYSTKQDLSIGSRELNTKTLHQIREMDYHHLFTKLNVGTARQARLNAEVRMSTEYCLSERSRLKSECKKQADLLKARDDEIKNLKAHLLLKEAEAIEVVRLRV